MKTQERPQSPLQGTGTGGAPSLRTGRDAGAERGVGSQCFLPGPQAHDCQFLFPSLLPGSRLLLAGHLFLTSELNVTSSRRWPRGEEGD